MRLEQRRSMAPEQFMAIFDPPCEDSRGDMDMLTTH